MSSDLTFSFVGTPDERLDNRPAPAGSELSFSFVGEPIPAAERTAVESGAPEDMAAAILARQSAGQFPQGARPDIDWSRPSDYWGALKRSFFGSDRETAATRNLPSLADVGVAGLLGDERVKSIPKPALATVSAALLTAFDPVEMVQMLSDLTGGEIGVRPDEAGNILLSLDGREAILNRPGMSKMDVAQLGGTAAAFTPAGRAATAPGIMSNVGRVGAATAATQAAIEGGQLAAGGQVDVGDIGLAGVTGGVAQGVLQALAQRVVPALRERLVGGRVTEKLRREYRKAAEAAGIDSSVINDDVIRATMSTMDDRPVGPVEAVAMRAEAEFGVPLTSGQRSLNQPQLSFEDSARSGALGPKPQETMLAFERDVQSPAIETARTTLEESVGSLDGRPGAIIRGAIQDAERSAAGLYGDAYSRVGDASLSVDGTIGLMKNLRLSMRGVEYDRTLPQTKTVLDLVAKQTNTLNALKDKGLRPTSLKTLDNMRRRLNTALDAAENNSDRRQVRIIKRTFDDYIDNAIENALFTGDETAIASLKEARGLFHNYAKKFRANDKRNRAGRKMTDTPGRNVESIIDANPSDEEVVNFIFGAGGISKPAGAAVARRFRDILGEDSEGWQAVRREALRRLLKTTRFNNNDILSGQQSLNNLDKAMEKAGTMMREVFTDNEIAYMRRFFAHVKRTQPDLVRSRENPSGTAQKTAKLVGQMVPTLAHMFDPVAGLISVASNGGVFVRDVGAARAAVRPFAAVRPIKRGLVPAVVSGTMQASEQTGGGGGF